MIGHAEGQLSTDIYWSFIGGFTNYEMTVKTLTVLYMVILLADSLVNMHKKSVNMHTTSVSF